MKEHLIFTVSDAKKITSGIVPAYEVLMHRLKNNIWAVNKRTRNKDAVKSETKIIFYVAGTKKYAGCFAASAKVDEALAEFKNDNLGKYGKIDDWEITEPKYQIRLREINVFERPVKLLEIIDEMELYRGKNKKIWGHYLQGGTIKISEKDYTLIKSTAQQN